MSACAGIVLAGGGLFAVAGATETKKFTYDALGNLVEIGSTGSVNDQEIHRLCYDAVGNRT